MSIELTRNAIKRDRLIAGRWKSRRRRRQTSEELWNEYIRLAQQAHQAFNAFMAFESKRAAAVASNEAEPTDADESTDTGESRDSVNSQDTDTSTGSDESKGESTEIKDDSPGA